VGEILVGIPNPQQKDFQQSQFIRSCPESIDFTNLIGGRDGVERAGFDDSRNMWES